MKLSDKERAVFVVLQDNASASVAEIAKQCGYTEASVRNVMESMRRRSIIQTSLLIDESKMGLRHIKMLLNIRPTNGKTYDTIEKTILTSSAVAWVARTTGDYTHYISFYVSEFEEVENFFDNLNKQLGPVIHQMIVAEGQGWQYFGKKYLSPKLKKQIVVRTGFARSAEKLDETDFRIVAVLTKSPLASLSTIAREVSAPLSSVAYRIQRMRKLEIIGAPINRVNISNAEFVWYFVAVRLKFPSVKIRSALHGFGLQHPNIVEICDCFGTWDFEIGFEAEEAATLHSAISDFSLEFASYIHSLLLIPRFKDLCWGGSLDKLMKRRAQMLAS